MKRSAAKSGRSAEISKDGADHQQVRRPGVRDGWNFVFFQVKKVNIDDVDNQVSTLSNTLICINLHKFA